MQLPANKKFALRPSCLLRHTSYVVAICLLSFAAPAFAGFSLIPASTADGEQQRQFSFQLKPGDVVTIRRSAAKMPETQANVLFMSVWAIVFENTKLDFIFRFVGY